MNENHQKQAGFAVKWRGLGIEDAGADVGLDVGSGIKR
jgi:hypothetical protein